MSYVRSKPCAYCRVGRPVTVPASPQLFDPRIWRSHALVSRTLLALTLILGAPDVKAQTTWHVDDDAPPGGDGVHWSSAFNHLQDALGVAAAGDEVRVARGHYRPDTSAAEPAGTGDKAATFHLQDGVALRGGFAGVGSPDPDARDISLYETVLNGDLLGNDTGSVDDISRDDNSWHIVTGSGTDATAVLDGFTISHGGGGRSGSSGGAGMINKDGSPTVVDCMFVANGALSGGGMSNYGGHPTITGSTFTGNSGGKGGCIYNWQSNSTVTHCRFIANHGRSGGALYNEESAVTVVNSLFAGNTASHGGGAENWNNGHAVFTGCTFADNDALGGSAVSLGISSSAALIDCILWNVGEELEVRSGTTVSITYSDVRGGWTDDNCPAAHPNCNMDADPLFTPGPSGCYYLAQTAAGQALDSPCLDAGSDTAENLDVDALTTRSDEETDAGVVDMGYHYPVSGWPLIMGDYNRDRDLNLVDYAALQTCFTGEGPTEVPPCCRILDFESDADIDLDDHSAFTVEFNQ